MATIHGRGGMLYLSSGAGAATKIAEARSWKFSIDRELDDDNAMGDTWKTQTLGMLSFDGSIEGNVDTAEATVWNAAIATTTADFFFYPVASTSLRFYSGSAWVKLSVDLGLGGTARFTADLVGNSALGMA